MVVGARAPLGDELITANQVEHMSEGHVSQALGRVHGQYDGVIRQSLLGVVAAIEWVEQDHLGAAEVAPSELLREQLKAAAFPVHPLQVCDGNLLSQRVHIDGLIASGPCAN